MGPSSSPESFLLFLWISGICGGLAQAELMKKDNCTNYELVFERVFSVPGDAAMLNSTLLSPDVFNFTAVPFNITWFSAKTGQEMRNETGRILVLQETLWFLNTTMDDDGEYLTVVRTPSQCHMQAAKLVMEQPVAGECGRPRKRSRELRVMEYLRCPLENYTHKLKSFGISVSVNWYNGCVLIWTSGSQTVRDSRFHMVKVERSGAFTCTLTFDLDGATRSVSETISATVTADHFLPPQIHEPHNDMVKAAKGSNFTKRCLVFVPGTAKNYVGIKWLVENKVNFYSRPSERIYTSNRRWDQAKPKGVWFERLLFFSEVREEDFCLNYTCMVTTVKGNDKGRFTLLPADRNIILPIRLAFGGVIVLFIIIVTVYHFFGIDIVLSFRRAFPVLYTNKDLDGKLYDAYVVYPNPGASGFSEAVEKFALQTLPEVLEQACGYKLFIAGRDGLPGQAIVDSVDENLQASRRVLLLYTASTFIKERHTSGTGSNNNNITKIGEEVDQIESRTSEGDGSLGFGGDDKAFSDTRQHLECVVSLNRALLEGSLKVILVELEEITPAQLAVFPESVRHLRKKQGAVCWWKALQTREKWRMRREDEGRRGKDSEVSPSLSPSSRFWKEIRYHMPVRGKRAVYPEKTALLNL